MYLRNMNDKYVDDSVRAMVRTVNDCERRMFTSKGEVLGWYGSMMMTGVCVCGVRKACCFIVIFTWI